MKIPALLMRASMRPNRDTAVSAILAAVRGSPMSPSTSARFGDGGKGFVLEMFREFATLLYPRFRNASTRPAPIPWEAPVMIADFCVFGMRGSRPHHSMLVKTISPHFFSLADSTGTQVFVE